MSGIVGSYFNTRGSGVVAKLGTDGQVFTSTGAGLSQGFEAAAGGGGLLQFKQTQVTENGTRSGTTGAATWDEFDTDFRVVITPTLSTSKILVSFSVCASSSNYCYLRLVREESTVDTVIAEADADGSSRQQTTVGNIMYGTETYTGDFCGMTWLDAPATTNELTYKVEEAGHNTFWFNANQNATDNNSSWRSVSTIQASEIAVGIL